MSSDLPPQATYRVVVRNSRRTGAFCLVGLLSCVLAGCGWLPGSGTPTIQVSQGRLAEGDVEVDSATVRGGSPTATILTKVLAPDRFVISGYVIPRQNRGISMRVAVSCFSAKGGAAQFQDRFENGRRDGNQPGLSVTLDFEVDGAEFCSINAIAHPLVFRSVRTHAPRGLARVTLSCPTACRVAD
jgi:hypothetical protein